MRRKRDPETRNPLSCPLSKQRIMVCWETLQILAASPVVKTVFMGTSTPSLAQGQSHECGSPGFFPKEGGEPKSSLICLYPAECRLVKPPRIPSRDWPLWVCRAFAVTVRREDLPILPTMTIIT